MKGIYQLEKQPNGEAVLRRGEIALKIRLRINPGPNKPKEFLIMFKPVYRYVSSLFPFETGLYTFDCENIAYTLHMAQSTASITEVVLQVVD